MRKVSLLGSFDAEFLMEINALTKSVSQGKVATDTECIFFRREFESRTCCPAENL